MQIVMCEVIKPFVNATTFAHCNHQSYISNMNVSDLPVLVAGDQILINQHLGSR